MAILSAPISNSFGQDGPPPASPVRTAPVIEDVIVEPIKLTGSVVPKRQTQISAETSGLVQEVLVDEGDYVQKGQVLARLRQKPTEIMIDAANGDLQIEQARLDELENGTRQEDIDAEKADVDEAKANLDFWISEEKRLKSLFDDNAVSESEYQSAKTSMDTAKATLLLETAEYERAVRGPRVEEINSQKGEVASKEAAVELQKDLLDRHIIRAPFDGIIGLKQIEIGQWVQTGAVTFGMAQIDELRVQVSLPERYFSDVQIGTVAKMNFPALPDKTITAPVTYKIPLANQAARTFPVRIEFKNTEFDVAPGMFANVVLKPQKEGSEVSMLVPKDAVVTTPNQERKVYVVRKGETGDAAFPVNVSLGRNIDNHVEIFSNELEPGNQVIIRGNETIKFPGENVRVIEEGEKISQSSENSNQVSSSANY